MSTDEILDAILVPRPNGSAALSQVADFLEGALRAEGAEVSRHLFEATPHGFALTWSAVLLLLYFIFIAYCIGLVQRAKDRFGALLVFGMMAIVFWHVAINVAMVTGLMPVVGVPLPMVSYGGSALASMMFAIGIMINVSMRRYVF